MKTLLCVLTFLIALPVAAYQAGPQNRTNFGAGQGQPGQQNYRSFSNYNNRSWGQGVQTRGVQTEVAGSSVTDFEKETPKKFVGKAPAAAPKQGRQSQPAATPVAPAQASTAPAAMPANVDPAAMMQQVQGMMNAMGNMTGGAPAGKAGQAPQQAGQGMPAGMPDLSALMGGAMPAAPAATPAKK